MERKKLRYIILLSFLFIVFSCGKKEIKENQETTFDSNYGIEMFDNSNFIEAISFYEKKENKNNEENMILAKSYLNYGNYYYKESEYSNKALELLEKMDDNFEKLYYIGYAYEISSKYDFALEKYNQALNLENISEIEKAIIINQIGHIYDLKGDLENANKYYLDSEKLGLGLVGNLLNRGRYEYRKKNTTEAEKYFLEVLEKSNDSFTKSEIYFNLSSIYLLDKDTYEKAIEYSEKGILENKDYPLNYLNKGIGYLYLGGNENINKAIEQLNKTIEIYPNSTLANKYLGISYYILDDFEKSISYFKKQLENSLKDIVLMKNEQEMYHKDAIYDLARTYSMINNIDESLNYLEQLLGNGENKNYYLVFLRDFAKNNGPFLNIMNDEKFKVFIEKVINLYK